jgi:hypothetical protein
LTVQSSSTVTTQIQADEVIFDPARDPLQFDSDSNYLTTLEGSEEQQAGPMEILMRQVTPPLGEVTIALVNTDPDSPISGDIEPANGARVRLAAVNNLSKALLSVINKT